MGFLKKITRPISKVLDKIVPNEIKPALPFLAAATPFMLPAGFGIGSLSPMVSRALAAGAANLGSQLAQEGSEGDFSGASLALATGIGALSAPDAGQTLRGMKAPVGDFDPARTFFQKAGDFGLESLATGADKLQGIMAAGKADPFSMAGLKAASIPITQGTTDLAIAETRRLNKQQIIDDALSGLGEGFSNADASEAIRLAMLQYGFGDDEITETIAAAGYADGGRVGLMMGGSSDPDFSGIKGAVISVDENMRADRAGDFFKLRDEAIEKGDDDKIKEIESDFFKEFGMVMPKTAKDGGRIGLANGGNGKLPIDPFQALVDYYLEMGASQSEAESLATNDYEKGIDAPKKKAKGGLMDLGGKEMDLRKGGFVPIGKKERADDVPARLSKNEFVMTADAVRAAGGGSVNKGAKRMYDLMNRLEARV